MGSGGAEPSPKRRCSVARKASARSRALGADGESKAGDQQRKCGQALHGTSLRLLLHRGCQLTEKLSFPWVPSSCLTVLLTAWFWEWSGLAALGMLYLIFIAPALTAWLAWQLRVQRTLSKFHACAFYICVAYTCLIVIGVPWAYIKTRPWHP
jgi:hypothetical protein